ncbi:FtsX-like permease family protein [Candidatus Falkowbacteria bacterium]|nr:FtsX-like permease family protein [Candidatus Falkowbacteria bacterium]
MIFKYSRKILYKEKEKFFLPFISILLTSSVVVLSYFLISSTSAYLSARDKEFIGGDVAIESSKIFDISTYLSENKIKKITKQINFQGLISSKENATGVDFTFVDQNFPLYGVVGLESGSYIHPNNNEIYIDENLKQSLNLKIGDTLKFNDRDFFVKGVVTQNPESLLSGFSFSPKVILSEEAIAYSQIDLALFRKEYRAKAIVINEFNKEEKTSLKEQARKNGARVNFEGGGESGLQFGLEVVKNFLIVVILVIIILALVNIYSSVSFLAERLRRSFAILMALGLKVKDVYKILLLVNSFVILAGIVFGSISACLLNSWIIKVVGINFQIYLTENFNLLQIILIVFLIYITSLFATLPVINKLKSLSPKELLINSKNKESSVYKNIFKDILLGLFPVTFIAIYFLESFFYGVAVVGVIIITYGLVMFFYSYVIKGFYRIRSSFPFFIKLIISQKKFDAFLGLITFASLFVALTAVFNLSILRSAIDEYLRGDLRNNIPSVYVLDLQKSQIDKFKSFYPDSTLFPNVRSRLVSIDGLDIQKELEKEDSKLDREFTREFNLTYRNNLLSSEEVVEGSFESIKKGEVSLEQDFAKRLNAKLGSMLVLNIQGFTLEAKVASIRKVDTRSGMPFFFLVFSPDDLEQFPNTSFGYLNIPADEIGNLSKKLSSDFPNVSLIDTSRVTRIAENIIGLLLIIVLIITIPPIVLSTLLIINIITIMSKDRKRDGARLMALGKTKKYLRNFFIFESSITLLLSSLTAYVFAVFLSNFLIIKFIEIDNRIYFDLVSFNIFISIFVGIIIVSFFIWTRGDRSIKDYLNYEENN